MMQRPPLFARRVVGYRWCASTSRTATVHSFHTTASKCNEKSFSESSKTVGVSPGAFARTNDDLLVEHPKEDDLPTISPVQNIGGVHNKRTLATFSLEGKVGVVTGGARGLGALMGQAMVLSGANIAIVDLHREEAEKQTKKLLETFAKENAEGTRLPKITAHYADVSDPESVRSVIGEIISQHGKIDHLVTSAGFCENIAAVNYPPNRLRKMWSVNVDGTYFFAAEVAKHLMERKSAGSMVFIGSMSGNIVNIPQPQAPYNASKAAVRHLASSFAVEWASAGIRVNCISPGYMLTPLTEKILDKHPDLRTQWTTLTPQGRLGQPQDLMGATVFLLSEASSYVTGADLRVDGGYTLV